MLKEVLRQFLPLPSRRQSMSFDSAMELVDKGRFDEAERVFHELAILNSEDPQPRFLLGYVRYRGGQYLSAARALEQAVALAPDRADIYYTLGRARLGYGAFVE